MYELNTYNKNKTLNYNSKLLGIHFTIDDHLI